MANAISPIVRQVSKPYLSLMEFKNAPTALDYGNLVVGGNQAAQDAELTNAITRASSYIDQYCNQIIGATLDTEQQRVRVATDGSVIIHPKYFPIVAVTEINLGPNPQMLTALPDPSIAWLEEQQIVIPYANANLTWSSQGALGFALANGGPRSRMYANYTYVNGYANTVSVGLTSIGDTSIDVQDGLGLVPGEQITIFDGAATERVTVASSYVFGSNTVPLTAPIQYNHLAGTSVSALPAAIKEAAILITSAYLKIRGDASLIMDVTTRPGQQIDGSQKIGSDLAHAQEILKPFRRIR